MVFVKESSQLYITRTQWVFKFPIYLRSSRQWYFISQYLERFDFTKKRMIPTPVLLSNLRGFPFSGCWWSMLISMCLIGNIACNLKNIPPVSSSADEATPFFVFVRRLGWGLSVLVWDCRWLAVDC